jgi:hypothetical protein
MKTKELLPILEAIHHNASAWINMVKKLGSSFYKMPKNPTPQDFLDAIEATERSGDVSLEMVSGIKATINSREVTIYPLARYEWDAGDPIFTELFNLRPLATSSICDGPFAEICVSDHYLGIPGIAVHNIPRQGLMRIHVFD